jgi:hypothetical protein
MAEESEELAREGDKSYYDVMICFQASEG